MYSLKVPHLGTPVEYPQHMFSWKNKKINLSGDALLSGAMTWGCEEVSPGRFLERSVLEEYRK